MSDISALRDMPIGGGAIRSTRSRDIILVLLLLLVLIRAGHVLAGEQPNFAVGVLKPDFKPRPDSEHQLFAQTATLFDLPKTYLATDPAQQDLSAGGDFRPRGHSVLEHDPQFGGVQEPPMLRSTNMWQRLADYRSQGRVRLLTLWEAGDSSVSLQAGKKGEPSLQWNSRSMNHGGATRGVFDQLLPASMTNGSRTSHVAQRPAGSDPATRPAKPSDAGMGAIK